MGILGFNLFSEFYGFFLIFLCCKSSAFGDFLKWVFVFASLLSSDFPLYLIC